MYGITLLPERSFKSLRDKWRSEFDTYPHHFFLLTHISPFWRTYESNDKYITRYRWLLIDSDPERVSSISSTDEEHQQALAQSRFVAEELRKLGWPAPIEADSGNGAHLLYRIDLAAQESALVKRVLEGLAARFNRENMQIDRTVYNPARICKLYGTLACKGDNTAERPHRTPGAPSNDSDDSDDRIGSLSLQTEQHICTTKWEKRKKDGHTLLATRFSAGYWWCDQCEPQSTFMETGERLNYPQITIESAYGFVVKQGCKEWLRFAAEAGYSLVKQAGAVALQRAKGNDA